MKIIDGSVLEGGGQILRAALSISAICKIPLKICNIRAGRSKPGLAAQHLKGIELLQQICSASVKGAYMGSTEVEFTPGEIKGGKYYADTQTAGSIALLLQVALPVLYFADTQTHLILKGGTNADMAPQIDFITEIFRPNLENFDVTFDFQLFKRGYFPKGGGHVEVTVQPSKYLQSINLSDFGEVEKVYGWSFVAGRLPLHIAEEMSDGAKSMLKSFSPKPINIQVYKESPEMAVSECSGIILGCQTSSFCIIGGSSLGNRNVQSFKVGEKAAQEIIDAISIQSCVDCHVQDQMIVFMALSKGKSKMRCGPLTVHTKTVIWVVEQMLDIKFSVIEDNGTLLVECVGVGIENKNSV